MVVRIVGEKKHAWIYKPILIYCSKNSEWEEARLNIYTYPYLIPIVVRIVIYIPILTNGSKNS